MEANTSLLYEGTALYTEYQAEALYVDLNIDQILRSVTEGKDEFHLDALYLQKPVVLADVLFRQAVAGDLLDGMFCGAVERFLALFSRARRYSEICGVTSDRDISAKWHLDAVRAYCAAVDALLSAGELAHGAEGWKRLFAWVKSYAASDAYLSMRDLCRRLTSTFEDRRFSVRIDLGNEMLTIGEDGQSADIVGDFFDAFERLDLRGVRREIQAFPDIRMNSLEMNMLALLKERNEDLFGELHVFQRAYPDFFDARLLALERQAWFYLSFLQYAARMRDKGHRFTFPAFSAQGQLSIEQGYDLSLAQMEKTHKVVCNDVHMRSGERIMILTGINQGGKTTFARMLGQMFFFACAGLPVPCACADLPFAGDIYTHFAREETAGSQSGRLQDELLRLRPVVRGARGNSVLLLNELFASTTVHDACELGVHLFRMLEEKGCLCLFVTHVCELADRVPGAVSLVAESIAREDGEPEATYRVVRKPADGMAYAVRLLRKHRLTKEEIEVRMHAAIAAGES